MLNHMPPHDPHSVYDAFPDGNQGLAPGISWPADTVTSGVPGPAITKTAESQQHSAIGNFFKKLFKRGGKEKKDKTADPRSTVQEVSSEDSKSMYEEIRQKCLRKSTLWEDPDFPAIQDSIYVNEAPVEGEIEWKRPGVSTCVLILLLEVLICMLTCYFKHVKVPVLYPDIIITHRLRKGQFLKKSFV